MGVNYRLVMCVNDRNNYSINDFIGEIFVPHDLLLERWGPQGSRWQKVEFCCSYL